MRIVSGRFGGRKLFVPKGRDIRPTSDKVRGAVFNALQSRGAVENAYVLDGFCGTGALGLEALSRGAAHCLFIDKSRTSLELAKQNARALGAENADFLLKDLAKIEQRPDDVAPASLVFLDPPYNRELLTGALQALHEGAWMKEGAPVVAEVERSFETPVPAPYKILDERTYGDTKILFLGSSE